MIILPYFSFCYILSYIQGQLTLFILLCFITFLSVYFMRKYILWFLFLNFYPWHSRDLPFHTGNTFTYTQSHSLTYTHIAPPHYHSTLQSTSVHLAPNTASATILGSLKAWNMRLINISIAPNSNNIVVYLFLLFVFFSFLSQFHTEKVHV